jgi:hypothetical protein
MKAVSDMGGKASRDKGKRFEREVRDLFTNAGFSARRSAQYCGANGDHDVIVDGTDLSVECKGVNRMSMYPWLEQSKADARDGELPIVVSKQDRKPVIVTMEWDTFIKIYRAYYESIRTDKKCETCGHYKPTDDTLYGQELQRKCDVAGGWRPENFSCNEWKQRTEDSRT